MSGTLQRNHSSEFGLSLQADGSMPMSAAKQTKQVQTQSSQPSPGSESSPPYGGFFLMACLGTNLIILFERF